MLQNWYLVKHKSQYIQGKIDPEDSDLCRYNWNLTEGYARCGTLKNQNKTSLLHRIIAERMGIVAEQIDHRNGDKLDNRRENLRGATNSQNGMNKKKNKNNTSGFKGVSEDKRGRKKKWEAKLNLNGKCVYQEYFYTAEDAARAYDVAALKYHGEYAQLNFPLETI